MSVTVVADIGINHNGDIKLAERLIDACIVAGVDIVKFQTVNADYVYKKNDPLYKIFKDKEFNLNQWIRLKNRVVESNVEFLSTPGDMASADMLASIGVNRFKIASDSAANTKFVNYVARLDKPFIVSTGMLMFEDAVKLVTEQYERRPQFLMHCVSKYPTPPEEAHLENIVRYSNYFKNIGWDIKIGYSDHVAGYDASLAAVAMGAQMIEKHIKWDDNCVDAAVSLNPIEFSEMIKKIRKIEQMI